MVACLNHGKFVKCTTNRTSARGSKPVCFENNACEKLTSGDQLSSRNMLEVSSQISPNFKLDVKKKNTGLYSFNRSVNLIGVLISIYNDCLLFCQTINRQIPCFVHTEKSRWT